MSGDGGLASFQRRMRAIPKAAREAVTPALMREAHDMADLMERLVPEDDGDLMNSITVTGPGEPTPPHSQPGGSAVVPENGVAITAGNSEVRYAHMVEYGTAAHDVSKGAASVSGRLRARFFGGRQHPGMTAQPFFWPAYRMRRKRALNRIKRAIGKAIKEAK